MDTHIKEFVRRSLKKNHTVIVEIGAHYGEDTQDLLDCCNPRVIHCFEPDPRNIAIIKDYISDRRVMLHEYAISDNDGEADFYQGYKDTFSDKMFDKYSWIPRDRYVKEKLNGSGASSLKRGHSLVQNAEPIRVKTIRFESWANANKIDFVDFMWIDVQGAEKEVVCGLGYMVKYINYIWVEFGEISYEGGMTRKQTINRLYDLGFCVIESQSDQGKKGNLLLQYRD
jgi:2-O-methyltransferase